jgi:hypothetical protein
MKVKKFTEFNESNIPIGSQNTGGNSGGTTAPVGPMGPNYGSTKLRNNTITSNSTEIIYSPIDSKLYTYDDYQIIYQEYLKKGGKPMHGFSENNLNTIILHLN